MRQAPFLNKTSTAPAGSQTQAPGSKREKRARSPPLYPRWPTTGRWLAGRLSWLDAQARESGCFPTHASTEERECPTLALLPSLCVSNLCFTPSPALVPLVHAHRSVRGASDKLCKASILLYSSVLCSNAWPHSHSSSLQYSAASYHKLPCPHVLSRQQRIRNYRRSLPTCQHCHAPTPTNTSQPSLLDGSLRHIICLLASPSNILRRFCRPVSPLLSFRLARRPQHAPWQIQPPTPSREFPGTGRSDRKPSAL